MSHEVIIKQTTTPAFWMEIPAIARLYEVVREQGGDIRAVGGAVRDFLLNRPTTDIDFACSLTPDIMKKVAEKLSAEVRLHGEFHGTIMIILDRRAYEITSLRKDIRTDGRHAEVEFGGDWQSDAARRDFTINAMSMDASGKIYDYCGGLKDLEKQICINFVGDADKRIQEDYLRILRFLRFFATLKNSHLDNSALLACERHKDALQNLSVERRRDEFLKLLAGEQSAQALALMQEHGILSALDLPIAPPLPNFADIKGELRMNFYLLHFARNDINGFCQTWRLNNHQARLLSLVDKLRWQDEGLDYLLQLHGKKAVGLMVLLRKDEASWAWNYVNSWKHRDFPVGGDDIKELLNCEGRDVGDYLDRGVRHWLSHERQLGRDDLLNWYKGLAKS